MKDLEISFTNFIDFIAATDRGEVGVVSSIKQLYESAEKQPFDFDYYGPVRRAIFHFHNEGSRDPSILQEALSHAKRPSQLPNFEACINGYLRFAEGRRKFGKIAKVSPAIWETESLRVRLNPDFVLSVNGKPEVMKLHYKESELTLPRVRANLYLLNRFFGTYGRVCVMDLRRGRTIPFKKASGRYDIFLSGRAAAFAQIWRDLERGSAA